MAGEGEGGMAYVCCGEGGGGEGAGSGTQPPSPPSTHRNVFQSRDRILNEHFSFPAHITHVYIKIYMYSISVPCTLYNVHVLVQCTVCTKTITVLSIWMANTPLYTLI